tara:strand:- start:2574 stop:3212 length:639 start_codon:yes stop_codon:yes gene_type:complete
MIFFDIETGPLTEDELRFREPSKGFQPRANLTDPKKIEDDIAAKRENWKEKATLSAYTSRVWAIGYHKNGETSIDHYGANPNNTNEAGMLEWFFEQANGQHQMCGFNINAFDVPYIIRRAYALGVYIPGNIRNPKYLRDKFLDLMDLWTLWTYRSEVNNRISLNALAKHLGLKGKTDSGANFWRNMISDQKNALAYLKRDVELLVEVHDKIG